MYYVPTCTLEGETGLFGLGLFLFSAGSGSGTVCAGSGCTSLFPTSGPAVLGCGATKSCGKPGGVGNSSNWTGFPRASNLRASSNCLQIRPYLRALEEFPSVSAVVCDLLYTSRRSFKASSKFSGPVGFASAILTCHSTLKT